MKRIAAVVGAGALAVFAVPALGDFWTFVATLAAIYALLGLSLVVLTGWTGQLNLHVAALGLGWGAYASFALFSVGAPPLLALLAAPVLTVPFSLAVGAVAVRFRGLELAVATVAIGLTFERLVFRNLGSWLSRSGTSTPFASSFVQVPRPHFFETDHAFYLLTLLLGVLCYLVLLNLARGRTRRTMLALREREVAAEVAGIPALRYRIGAFVLSIAVAGLAGALFAGLKQGIAPESFDLNLSFLMLAAVVIGGIRTLRGGAFGGILAAVLPEVVRFGPLRLISGERLTFLFAAGLVLTLAFRPRGLLAPRARHTSPVRDDADGEAPSPARRRRSATRSLNPSAVRADGLSVHFGGVQALDDVSLSVPAQEICALIGPNGAGKTTLFNCLSGVVVPDRGRVYASGTDVTGMAPHRRAALGLGRTFQSVELFGEQSVHDNVTIAAHVQRTAGPFAEALALPAAHRSQHMLADKAHAVLGSLAIDHLADTSPDSLNALDLRRVELACVLVREPKILLLDEPTAGLSPTESVAFARLVASLPGDLGVTVVLVEHDMAVVGEIADWVYVLDFGKIIAADTPGKIRRNRMVIDRYLGETRARSA